MPTPDPKDAADFYFKPLTDRQNSKWKDDVDEMICRCGNVMKQPKNGYSNYMAHIIGQHKQEWQEEVFSYLNSKKGQKLITEFSSITSKARNIFKWLEWIVEDNLPFSFVEKQKTRSNSKLEPICRNTFMKYLIGASDIVV